MLREIERKIRRYLRRNRPKPPTVDQEIVQIKRQFSGRRYRVESRVQNVNVFLPTIDPANFFGGYLAMYSLARKFSEMGYAVRILLTEQLAIIPEDLEKLRNHDLGLKKFLTEVEFLPCYSHENVIPISERDIFVATSMISAHLASEAVKNTVYSRFIYLSQDYESIFYENGHYKVLAEQSYALDYFPIISTDILQRFYVEKGIMSEANKGVFFKNPVLKFDLAKDFRREPGSRKKLLFYARTQAHASRNLYYIGCLAIDRARELGHFQEDEWEIVGIGAGVGTQLLPSGIKINHIGKFDMQRYKELLPQHDLGLSLMHSPHPSLLPIEMASAGMLVVTNTYDIKDQAYFDRISSNIRAVEPDYRVLADALVASAQRVDDFGSRVAGSKVSWPQTWEEAFTTQTVDTAVRAVVASARQADAETPPAGKSGRVE